MSMNQYMHPRNVYRQPPNFKQLAIEYPEFRKWVTQDIAGKVTIDFKNLEALRALSCTLMKKDFDIDLEIPLDKLIPTIPLRLNYILWVEDLLDLIKDSGTERTGVDIGTGASCVYPLIGAKKNHWKMIATEIDKDSIKYARDNIKRNNLEHLITVIDKDKSCDLIEPLDCLNVDFLMCNPPFFASPQDLHPFVKGRSANRPRPKNAFCASVEEVVYSKGGEVEYISRIIAESKVLRDKIKIYTTMIGHKSSLPPLKKLLRDVPVVSFKQTEFCQGHTTRWGLAWTYLDLDLRQIPDSLMKAKRNVHKPLVHEFPSDISSTVQQVSSKLEEIFETLKFHFERTPKSKKIVEYVISTECNTWANQRRKRRADRLKSQGLSPRSRTLEEACDQLSEIEVSGSKVDKSCKRLHGDDDVVSDDDSGFYRHQSKRVRVLEEVEVSRSVYLRARISVLKLESSVGLELDFVEGTGTREALHQVLQYIKNSFGCSKTNSTNNNNDK